MPKRSASDVAESRSRVISTAVDVASVEGLEGLTIGRLASDLGMSKSGLIGRFGDKEALQLATLEAAIERFTQEVWRPAHSTPPGRQRLGAIVDAWIAHLRRQDFPGGCFVTTASVEYDARPGALHDAVKQAVQRWLATLEREAQAAIDDGEIPATRQARDIALELHSLASGGSVAARITDTPAALTQVRAAMRRAVALPEA